VSTYDLINLIFMQIILNKYLQAMLFGRWVMLSLYTIYRIVVWQMIEVFLIQFTQIHLFTQ